MQYSTVVLLIIMRIVMFLQMKVSRTQQMLAYTLESADGSESCTAYIRNLCTGVYDQGSDRITCWRNILPHPTVLSNAPRLLIVMHTIAQDP